MAEGSYNQFCPVAMAAEILCTRWTIVLLRELVAGSTRFNELRRGVPRMSPALLSKRLKDLEAAGVVTRSQMAGRSGCLLNTRSQRPGRPLEPVVDAIGDVGTALGHDRIVARQARCEPADVGHSAQYQPEADAAAAQHDPGHLLAICRKRRRNWWLIVEPGEEVDLCSVDPGFDVDLYVVTDLRTMTEIWMGYTTVARAKADERLCSRRRPAARRHAADSGSARAASRRWRSASPDGETRAVRPTSPAA